MKQKDFILRTLKSTFGSDIKKNIIKFYVIWEKTNLFLDHTQVPNLANRTLEKI